MSNLQRACNAADAIEFEINKRTRNSKAKAELVALLDAFAKASRGPDEAYHEWLDSVHDAFYDGAPANRKFLRKVLWGNERDIESPLKTINVDGRWILEDKQTGDKNVSR